MTDRKASAKANVGVLRFAQDDGEEQATAKATEEQATAKAKGAAGGRALVAAISTLRKLQRAHVVEELLVVAGLAELVGEQLHGFDRRERV